MKPVIDSVFPLAEFEQGLARIDLTGRDVDVPLSALGDRMALGGPEAEGLWRAHVEAARRAAIRAQAV